MASFIGADLSGGPGDEPHRRQLKRESKGRYPSWRGVGCPHIPLFFSFAAGQEKGRAEGSPLLNAHAYGHPPLLGTLVHEGVIR